MSMWNLFCQLAHKSEEISDPINLPDIKIIWRGREGGGSFHQTLLLYYHFTCTDFAFTIFHILKKALMIIRKLLKFSGYKIRA